jgi:hypothetical protein
MDLRRQLDDAIGVERRVEDAEILAVASESVLDVTADTALFLRRRLGHGVWRDLADEVLAKIGGEVGKAVIAQRLDGADDRGGIDAIAPRQLARRQEIGFLRVVENRPHQLPALAAQLGPREAHLERRARRLPWLPRAPLGDRAGGTQCVHRKTAGTNASTRDRRRATLVAG